MSKSSSSSSSGISFLGLLGIVFIVLKLVGVIDWSWWYVTMPLWGGVAVLLIILVIYVGYLIFNSFAPKNDKHKPMNTFTQRLQAKLDEQKAKSE